MTYYNTIFNIIVKNIFAGEGGWARAVCERDRGRICTPAVICMVNICMCVYVCVCVCMYVYVYIYIYIWYTFQQTTCMCLLCLMYACACDTSNVKVVCLFCLCLTRRSIFNEGATRILWEIYC